MSNPPSDIVNFLLDRYDVLKRRLAFRLGSRELAEDVLHDTYLRLTAHRPATPVNSPQSFIVRTAINLAIDRIRSDRRLLSGDDVELLLEQETGSIDPVDVAASRFNLETFARAMGRLPPLRRQLFYASRYEGVPQKELARCHGISLRKVELEIHLAHEYCMQQTQRDKDPS